jgi:activator of HSP90 ATPase
MTVGPMQMMRRALLPALFAGVAGAQQMTNGAANAKSIHESQFIHDEVVFSVPSAKVFEALMDSKQFAALTGASAEIHREAGATFSVFDGHITGRNIEVVPGKRVVQAWRAADWPEGVYSIAKFELVAQGAKTKLVFDHTGFPEGQAEHLEAGWKEHYWEPLNKYFSGK